MDLIQKYDMRVPRYTSYPTAPHFKPSFSSDIFSGWLHDFDGTEAVSIYIHIPFCHQLCWYCGCNTKVVNSYAPVAQYVEALLKEITHVSSQLKAPLQVSHLHFGGGTPTMLSSADFKRIYDHLSECFILNEAAEKAVEIDPRSFTAEMADTLVACGINRVSFGVQDFDADVQKVIHRIQPYEQVEHVVSLLRERGINAINFDLIYGLPLQTEQSIEQTIEQTLTLSPSRIALFGYAHVPWMKKHQKLLDAYPRPDAHQRLAMFDLAAGRLTEAGYAQVGLDHFARADDTLVHALKNGGLYRNFQGYTTDSAKNLLAFGASAIGETRQGFVQNHTSVKAYMESVLSTGYGLEKGLEKSADDQLRALMIERLMCDYKLDLEAYALDADFQYNEDFLHEMVADGLVVWQGRQLEVTVKGRPYVRLVASLFDAYLGKGERSVRHSQAV